MCAYGGFLNIIHRSSDGNTLVVSSTDGYCSIINFKSGEIGQIYQPNEPADNVVPVDKNTPTNENEIAVEALMDLQDKRADEEQTKSTDEPEPMEVNREECEIEGKGIIEVEDKNVDEKQSESTGDPMEVNTYFTNLVTDI